MISFNLMLIVAGIVAAFLCELLNHKLALVEWGSFFGAIIVTIALTYAAYTFSSWTGWYGFTGVTSVGYLSMWLITYAASNISWRILIDRFRLRGAKY